MCFILEIKCICDYRTLKYTANECMSVVVSVHQLACSDLQLHNYSLITPLAIDCSRTLSDFISIYYNHAPSVHISTSLNNILH